MTILWFRLIHYNALCGECCAESTPHVPKGHVELLCGFAAQYLPHSICRIVFAAQYLPHSICRTVFAAQYLPHSTSTCPEGTRGVDSAHDAPYIIELKILKYSKK
jgi:hypothetical protein